MKRITCTLCKHLNVEVFALTRPRPASTKGGEPYGLGEGAKVGAPYRYENGNYARRNSAGLLNELCPWQRTVIAGISKSDGACQALDFLRRRARAWLQASDTAYHIWQPLKQTQRMLDLLTQAGTLEQFTVLNQCILYGLSQHSESIRALTSTGRVAMLGTLG